MSDVDFYSYMDDGGDIFEKVCNVLKNWMKKYGDDYVIQASQFIELENVQVDDKFLY